MTDPAPPGTEHEPQHVSDEVPAGMPAGVKVVGVVVGIGILLLIVVMMVGGVEHGPQLHGAGSDAAADHGDNAAAIDGASEVAVAAGELRFDPDRVQVPAGIPVNVALTSTDIFHDLVIDEIGFYLGADRGDTVVGGLVFDEPGTYVAYCSVPGHRDAGMELEFVSGGHDDLEEFFQDLHG